MGELQDLLKAYSEELINQALMDFAHWLFTSPKNVTTEEKLIEQCRQAYLLLERERAAQEDIQSDWTAMTLNSGQI